MALDLFSNFRLSDLVVPGTFVPLLETDRLGVSRANFFAASELKDGSLDNIG